MRHHRKVLLLLKFPEDHQEGETLLNKAMLDAIEITVEIVLTATLKEEQKEELA